MGPEQLSQCKRQLTKRYSVGNLFKRSSSQNYTQGIFRRAYTGTHYAFLTFSIFLLSFVENILYALNRKINSSCELTIKIFDSCVLAFFGVIKWLQISTLNCIPARVYHTTLRCITLYSPDVRRRKFCDFFISRIVPPKMLKAVSVLYLRWFSIPSQINHLGLTLKENGCLVTLLDGLKCIMKLPLQLLILLWMTVACCFKIFQRIVKVSVLTRRKSLKDMKKA